MKPVQAAKPAGRPGRPSLLVAMPAFLAVLGFWLWWLRPSPLPVQAARSPTPEQLAPSAPPVVAAQTAVAEAVEPEAVTAPEAAPAKMPVRKLAAKPVAAERLAEVWAEWQRRADDGDGAAVLALAMSLRRCHAVPESRAAYDQQLQRMREQLQPRLSPNYFQSMIARMESQLKPRVAYCEGIDRQDLLSRVQAGIGRAIVLGNDAAQTLQANDDFIRLVKDPAAKNFDHAALLAGTDTLRSLARAGNLDAMRQLSRTLNDVRSPVYDGAEGLTWNLLMAEIDADPARIARARKALNSQSPSAEQRILEQVREQLGKWREQGGVTLLERQ